MGNAQTSKKGDQAESGEHNFMCGVGWAKTGWAKNKMFTTICVQINKAGYTALGAPKHLYKRVNKKA